MIRPRCEINSRKSMSPEHLNIAAAPNRTYRVRKWYSAHPLVFAVFIVFCFSAGPGVVPVRLTPAHPTLTLTLTPFQ